MCTPHGQGVRVLNSAVAHSTSSLQCASLPAMRIPPRPPANLSQRSSLDYSFYFRQNLHRGFRLIRAASNHRTLVCFSMPVAASPPATRRQRSTRLASRANDPVAPASSFSTPAKEETPVSTEVREMKTKTGEPSASEAPPCAATAPSRGRVVDFVALIKDRW